MFELQVGDKISIPSTLFKDPVFMIGRVGQGRSTTFLKIALEVIKNGGHGVIVDLYGDLARAVKSHAKSAGNAARVVNGEMDIPVADLKKHLKAEKMVVITGHMLVDGERKAREEGIKFMKKYFKVASKGEWLLVDEAFTIIDDDVFADYLKVKKMGLNVLFCEDEMSKLSEKEREKFCKMVQTYIVYKTMNFDAMCLEKYVPLLKAKDISAIQQYHFQVLMLNTLKYDRGSWPIQAI